MKQKVGTRMPATDVAAAQTRMPGLLGKNNGPQIPIHRVGVWYPQPPDLMVGNAFRNFELHARSARSAERHGESASPASLVSLYLLFMSLAV